ncbi:MAG: SLBB domain-containing protein [Bacteroidaceae bacterium]|nr:SLBB domain-containing protein [Bacteroidaceae bacterium]
MKRILLAFLCLTMLSSVVMAQGMSDRQVLQFIASEAKAGTSQTQIVTKLMQKGVNIDQIRRLRNQYDKQISSKGMSGAADGAVGMAASRMKANNDGTKTQELTTGRVGSTGVLEGNSADDVEVVEQDVKAVQGTAPDANGKQVFGRSIFSQANPSFQPNANTPVPDTYVLGPGDQVVVDIYGASQQTLIHTISPEGTITVEGYGPIHLSGLTVAGAQSKLRSTLGSRYQTSNLKVSVGNTRTIQVNIMGEVKAPGTYHLSSFANIFYALYRAGGPSNLGTLRNIQVFRNGRLVTVVDLYEYILNGRLAGNIILQDNDVIQVPTYECLVGITGNVKRPMFYEMRKTESVATLLKYAGGFTGDANKKSVRLVRQSGERYQVYNVEEFDMANFNLEDGDAVTVDGMINRFENMVEVKGAVFRPGQFHLDANIFSVRSLIEAAEGLTEDAYTEHAVLHRLKEDRSLEVVPVDVKGIMEGTVADIPLKNEDVLFIMTQEDLRQLRTVTISGEVMSPGTYQYADNTTIEDLIVMAGGLTDQASLMRVEVSRVLRDPLATKKSDQYTKKYHFDLKNGLVIDNERNFLLEPYDHITVYSSPVYSQARVITVSGEVNWEGTVAMEQRNTRLSDVISMVGGATPHAYLKGATLLRRMTDDERRRMSATMSAIRDILTENGDSVSYAKLDLDNNYPVYIDLDKAMKNPGGEADILMRDSDQLFVPEYDPVVRVSGDVMFPNTLYYEAGKKYKYYVEECGGFGHRAKKSKTFIVYQNGKAGLVKKGAMPEPGCEIVVVSKKKKSGWNIAMFTSALTGISSLASMITAISVLTRK